MVLYIKCLILSLVDDTHSQMVTGLHKCYIFATNVIFNILVMATHSSALAWRIPWTEEPGRLQSMGVAEGRTRLSAALLGQMPWCSGCTQCGKVRDPHFPTYTLGPFSHLRAASLNSQGSGLKSGVMKSCPRVPASALRSRRGARERRGSLGQG